MGYMDMLGLFKGAGKGVGPGVEEKDQQGGAAGLMRAGGGALEGVGAGLMSYNPRLQKALHAQDQAERGAYHDMYMDQQEQNRAASRTSYGKSILQSLDALRQQLFGTSKAGTDMPGTPREGVL